MKIKKTLTNKKRLIVLIILLIVLLGGYTAYAYTAKQWPFTSQDSSSTTQQPDQKNDSQTSDNQTLQPQSQSSTTDTTSPKTPVENTPSNNPPAKNEVRVSITSVIKNGSNIKVSTLIEDVTNSGDCTLVLEKDGQKVTKTAGIQALPSSSTCKGFDVPVSQLSAGTWHLTLTVNTNDKTGSATKDYKVS